MGGPTITFDSVNLKLSGNEILSNVNLAIEPGTIHCLIGPNGGGKTSLIRCLLGQMPHTGTISVDWKKDEIIGYVPQLLDFDKTLPISVTDFMSMVCQIYRPAFTGLGKRHRVRADAALERVGLSGKGKARLNFLATNEGIGDPPGGMKRTRHQHPQLGEIKVEHEEDGDFLSDWIEVDGGWFAVGGSDTLDVDLDALIPLLATAP